MATSRVALGSVLDTVAQTANSISALVNTTTKGIGMLDAFVTKAAGEQQLSHKAKRHTFIKDLIRQSAMEDATAKEQALTYCSKSEQHKKLYETSFDEFSALFAEELTPKSPE